MVLKLWPEKVDIDVGVGVLYTGGHEFGPVANEPALLPGTTSVPHRLERIAPHLCLFQWGCH